jgi:replicative DNA helicase
MMFKWPVRDIFSIKELVKDSVKNIDLMCKNKSILDDSAIPFGFLDLDIKTAGLNPGTLTVIAGRPGMGKSAFVLSIVRNLVVDGKSPVLIFTLEMNKEELVKRMLCSEARVDSHKARTGYLSSSDWPLLTAAATRLSEAPVFIVDTPGISIRELCVKARRLKGKEGIKLIVIDCLQLMYDLGKPNSGPEEVSVICRSLKALARDLQIPIILTSRLPRSVESREGNRPWLSDLRELGDIEQSADMVMLLFREEYYKPLPENKGLAEIILAKNRGGPIGSLDFAFQRDYTRFEDIKR